jgi:hypothetical protein
MKAAFLLVLFLVHSILSREWYVSQQRGSDSNPGTFEKPFLTYRKANESIHDGDTLKVEHGVYNERFFFFYRSVKYIGIPENNVNPLFLGALSFEGKNVFLTNIDFENVVFFKNDLLEVHHVNIVNGPRKKT